MEMHMCVCAEYSRVQQYVYLGVCFSGPEAAFEYLCTWGKKTGHLALHMYLSLLPLLVPTPITPTRSSSREVYLPF